MAVAPGFSQNITWSSFDSSSNQSRCISFERRPPHDGTSGAFLKTTVPSVYFAELHMVN